MWVITTVGELRDAILPFTDECTIAFDNGEPMNIDYKIGRDGFGKLIVTPTHPENELV